MTNEVKSGPAQTADLEELLKDPVAVHVNMLRGTIAKPSWAAIKHLYPEEFAALAPGNPGAANEIHSSDGGVETQTRDTPLEQHLGDRQVGASTLQLPAGVAPGPSEELSGLHEEMILMGFHNSPSKPSPSPATQPQPDSNDTAQLISDLEGFHDCADGDVSAGNGHFRLECISDSDQQRVNLRAVLREAATTIRALTARVDAPAAPPADAGREIAAERQRQIDIEGWDAAHDDAHNKDEIARAAACYAIAGSMHNTEHSAFSLDDFLGHIWPWDFRWLKTSTGRRRSLVKAGALIVAEIERLDRALPPDAGDSK